MNFTNINYKLSNFSANNLFNYLKNDLLLIRYWDKSTNFGDFMNPFIFESLSGKKVESSFKFINFLGRTEIIGMGSIISGELKNTVIWGSGVISEDVKIKSRPEEVLHVRGKKTKLILEKFGIKCPDLFGDPALLLPKLVAPSSNKKFKLGIVIHYNDQNKNFIPSFLKKYNTDEILFINPLDHYLKVIDQITSCEFILSSSLHGLIVAETYGVSTLRLNSNELTGGNFKFDDHYSSLNLHKHNVLYLKLSEIELNNDFFGLFTIKEIPIDLNVLKINLLNFIKAN